MAERQLCKEAKAPHEVAEQVEDHSPAAISVGSMPLGSARSWRPSAGNRARKAQPRRLDVVPRLARALVGAADYLRDGVAVYRAWARASTPAR